MLRRLVLVALALCLAAPGWADDSLQKAILAKEDAFFRSMVQADRQAMETLLADEFHAFWPDAAPADKAGQLDIVGQRWTVTKVVPSHQKVRCFNGDTAIVTGKLTFDGTFEGRPIEVPRYYTHVWVKQGSEWKLVSRHMSRFEE